MTIENIKKRNEILSRIRKFFNNKGYLEVETPILSPSLIPESAIEVFKTTHVHPYKADKDAFLVPSPEVWLKQFISNNPINIFEISKCFRNSEQHGRQHNPEFSMIEYYSMGFDHRDSIKLTTELLNYLNEKLPYSKLPRKHLVMTMEEAFQNYAGFSLEKKYTIEKLREKADILGINWDKNDNWEVTFNRIFLDKVEPSLPKDVNLFLTDFPSNIETLAKKIPGTPWAQRWELYIGGLEVGNCYSEERDPQKVRDYFNTEKIEKENALVKHNVNEKYYTIFKNFPKCSGGAIGLDRLIMGILGLEDIQGVILFPHHDNI